MMKQGPLSGHMLGEKYLLEELLGKGGFGAVYKAENQILHRPQAVKVLLEEHFSDEKFRDRFLREARTLGALDHANIVHVDDIGVEDTLIYLVMPYIGGGTLQSVMKARAQALGLDVITRYLEQICSALGYAHAQQVAHLDLKPLNLLVHNDGRLLLSDFGLAHLMEQGAIEGGTSLQFGSPLYMAPEHFEGRPGQGSDIYALGVILYQMLTGRHPFEASTPAVIMRKHLTELPPPLRTVRSDLPPELEGVLAKALAKQPEQRYSRAGELLIGFKAALSGQINQQGSGSLSSGYLAGGISHASLPPIVQTGHSPLSTSHPQGISSGSDTPLTSGPTVAPASPPTSPLAGTGAGATGSRRDASGTGIGSSQPTPAQPSGADEPTILHPPLSASTVPSGAPAHEQVRGLGDSPTRIITPNLPGTPPKRRLWAPPFIWFFGAAAGVGGLLIIISITMLANTENLTTAFTIADQWILLVQCALIGACLVALRFARSWLLRAGLLLQSGSLLCAAISSVLAVQAGASLVPGFPVLAFTHLELVASLLNAASLVCISYEIARWKLPLDAVSLVFQVILSTLGAILLWRLGHFSGTLQDVELAAALACDLLGACALLLRPLCWRSGPVIASALILGSLPFRLHAPYGFRIIEGFSFLYFLNIRPGSPINYGLLYGLFLASSFLLFLGVLVLIQTERLQKLEQKLEVTAGTRLLAAQQEPEARD